MDPLTHLLTGATMARAGFNRRSAYATVVMTMAAEAPDLDTVWSWKGPVYGFLHHRGWTHSFLGLPVDAAVVVGAVWLWDRRRRRGRAPTLKERVKTAGLPPARWGLLYGFALVALLSHLLLDWTNNYGLRPFWPFDTRWYAGSFVFIVEPVLLLLLVGGLLAPVLTGLVGAEIGAKRERFRGRGAAWAALAGIAVLYGLRGYERVRAEELAVGADYGNVPIVRSTVSPYPINPFRWHAVVETPDFFQTSTVDTLTGQVSTTAQEDLFYKPAETADTLAAKGSLLGRAYLDWSHFALVTASTQPTAEGLTAVEFRDLRYMYDTIGFRGREEAPLSGRVLLNEEHEVVRMEMDGKVQR